MISSGLRDSIYDVVSVIVPNTEIVFAYTGGPEPVTPYLVIDMQVTDQEGREYTSHFTNALGEQKTDTQYKLRVRFEFEGNAADFAAADLAEEFHRVCDYNANQELFLQNGLSYQRKSAIRKIPKKRETDWYFCYQMDIYFGYQVEARQNVDTVESVTIDGDYETFQSTIQIP